jgi:hypothetical protein
VNLFFAKRCDLIPTHRFGAEHNNVNIVVDEKGEWMTILSPSSTESIDHIIDIPLFSVYQLVAIFQEHSQEEVVQLMMHIQNDGETFCYLDGEGIKLEGIHMTLASETLDAIEECLLVVRPNLEVREEYTNPNVGVDGGNPESQKSSTTKNVIVLDVDDGHLAYQLASKSGLGNRASKDIPESQPELGSDLDNQLSDDEGNNFKTEVAENLPLDDIYDASPPPKRTKPVNQVVVEEQVEVGPDSPQKNPKGKNALKSQPKKRKSVKPVAKPPIRVGQQEDAKDSAPQKPPAMAKQVKQLSKTTTTKDQAGEKLSDAAKVAASEAKASNIFNSEPLSGPETNDASTPKVQNNTKEDDGDFVPPKTGTQTRANVSQVRSQKLDATAIHAARAKGRSNQSLSQAKAPSSDAGDVFEIPGDEDDDYEPTEGKGKSKAASKAAWKSQKPSNAQSKKAAPKAKADPKKRHSAPVEIESVQPTKGKAAAEKRESQQSMPPPPKPKVNDKKRQSAPPKIENIPPEPRVTRSGRNATSQAREAENQSQESKAKSVLKTVATQSEQATNLPQDQQDDFLMGIDDDSMGSIPILDDIVKETPAKNSSRPMTVPKKSMDNGAKELAKNSGLYMASQLDSMLDFTGTGEDTAKDPPVTSVRRGNKKRAVKDYYEGDMDELAGPSEIKSPTIARPSAEANAGPNTFKVPDKPARSTKTRDGGQVIKGKAIQGPAKTTPLPAKSSTPAEQSGGSKDSRKRKAPIDEGTPSKRPRPAKVDAQAQDVVSPRRSPGIVARLQQQEQNHLAVQEPGTPAQMEYEEQPQKEHSPVLPSQRDSQSHIKAHSEPVVPAAALAIRPSQKPRKTSPSPTRRSLRGRAKGRESTERQETTNLKTPLVDDRLSRKPGVISFNKHGALNQGISSTPRESLRRSVPTIIPAKELSDGKRKRDADDLIDTQSPPKKRQNGSPLKQDIGDESEENDHPVFGSSPPQPVPKPTKPNKTHLRLARQSSQGSRVDLNGSPRASPGMEQIDHIGKAKLKLQKQSLAVEEQMQPEQQTPQVRERRISDAFGPRVRLSGQAKTRPTSPEKSEPRYVAHKKTNNGHYEKVNSKEVILPEKEMPDPFIENVQQSSNFNERLRAPIIPQKCHGNGGQKRVAVRGYQEDAEKTLVNAENRVRVDQLAPSLTSGSTADSRSSEASRSPLREIAPEEEWNMAVRPHYATLTQAVHRIADVSDTSLSYEYRANE